MWRLYALSSAIFAAAVAILGKKGLIGIDTTLATTIRAIIMAFFLIVVSLSLGKFSDFHGFDKRAVMLITGSAIAGALSWLCYFLALKTGAATSVAVLDRLSIVFVLVFAFIFLGESLTFAKLLGVALMVGGALLVVWW